MNKMPWESEEVEYKKSTSELKEAIISLTAMLNKKGTGTVYFGVKDDRTVVGLEIGNKTMRDISQAISNNVKPEIMPRISIEFIDNQNVIKVEAEGEQKPYSAYDKYYIRIGEEDKKLNRDKLVDFVQKSVSKINICEIENKDQDLTFNSFLLYANIKNLTVNKDTFEKNFDLKTKNNKYNLMSYLLADNNDISIKVNTFKDNDKSVLLKRNEYGNKCLFYAIESVLNYVGSINDTYVDLSTATRSEQKLFNFECFREAWLNACIHNRWDEKYPPQVNIFKDYIQIESNGGIPRNMTKEEFFKGVSRPVNEKLQKIFMQLDLVEQTGHGVPLIVKKYGEEAFEIDENTIWVKIPFNRKGFKRINEKENKNNLNDNQIKVIKTIEKESNITINKLSSTLSLSEGYIKKIINQLKNKNLIERNGSRKNGNWTIISYNL